MVVDDALLPENKISDSGSSDAGWRMDWSGPTQRIQAKAFEKQRMFLLVAC